MSEADNITRVRSSALERIERSERNYRAAFYGAVALETLFLVAFLLLGDLKENRTHLLLFMATVASYTIVALAIVALGAHVNRNTLRLLKAIELLSSHRADERR